MPTWTLPSFEGKCFACGEYIEDGKVYLQIEIVRFYSRIYSKTGIYLCKNCMTQVVAKDVGTVVGITGTSLLIFLISILAFWFISGDYFEPLIIGSLIFSIILLVIGSIGMLVSMRDIRLVFGNFRYGKPKFLKRLGITLNIELTSYFFLPGMLFDPLFLVLFFICLSTSIILYFTVKDSLVTESINEETPKKSEIESNSLEETKSFTMKQILTPESEKSTEKPVESFQIMENPPLEKEKFRICPFCGAENDPQATSCKQCNIWLPKTLKLNHR